MAKVKFPDLSGVEDIEEREHAPVGIYRAKIVSCEPKQSAKGNQMLEVRLHLTHDAAGKKLKTEYNDIWEYPILDHDHTFVQNKLKEFQTALGVKLKGGALDPEGKTLQVKLKSDTDQDGEYRPRVGKWMPVTVEDEEAPDDDEEEGTEEPEAEEEEDDGDVVDLDQLDRAELKKLIKDEELGSLADLGIKKSTTDAEIRAIIAEQMGGDDEEAEDEPEDEPEDDEEEPEASEEEEGDDYDTWSVPNLKKELKERELPQTGAKKVLIQRLRKDDGDSPF